MDNLHTYIKKLLPDEDVDPLKSVFSIERNLEKGETLVTPGQVASFLAYIDKGAFRVYYYDGKGNQITTWFSFENMFIADLPSFYCDDLANQHIEAIEESVVFIAQKKDLEKLYSIHPTYQTFGRKFAERGMVRVMNRMRSLQTKSAEERYLELMDQPEFLQRIPLKYLATYLGVTDTSLSRIRKSVSENLSNGKKL